MKKLLTYILTLFFNLIAIESLATIDFSQCWAWGDFGQKDFYNLYAINQNCSSVCYNNCYKNFSAVNQYNNELNRDTIYQCIESCQNGNTFTGHKRGPNNQDLGVYTITPCDTTNPSSANYPGLNYVKTDVIIPANKAVNISIFLASSEGSPSSIASGELYKCGIQYIYLNPTPYTANPCDYWAAIGLTPPNGCWSCPSISASANITQGTWDGTWSALKTVPTNLNMPILNNDWLSITMYGTYLYDCIIKDQALSCSQKSDSYNLNLYYDPDYNYSGAINSSAKSLIPLPGDQLKLAESDDSITDPATAANQDQSYMKLWPTFMGLKGTANISYDNTVLSSNGNTTINYFYKQKILNFQGIINSLPANKFLPLMVMHKLPNSGTTTSPTGLSLGGLNVEIERKGCHENDGSSIQYLILPSLQRPVANSGWQKLPFKKIGDAISNRADLSIPAPTENSSLFLRIAPPADIADAVPNCTSNTPGCIQAKHLAEQYVATADSINNFSQYGSYTVEIVQQDDSPTLIQDIFQSSLSQFLGIFYGQNAPEGVYTTGDNIGKNEYKTNKPGLIQVSFQALLVDKNIHTIIQIMLVLYIAWTGISYMLGIAPLNQQDALIRILKLSFVTFLLSPSSWDFLYNNFFSFFMQGSLELMSIMVSNSDSMFEGGDTACNHGTASFDVVFCIFNKPISVLFNPMLWARIAACCADSFLGLLMGMIAAIAMVIYAITIFNVLIMFLLAVVIISLLLMLSPVFISFILFSYTRQFFDEWIKMLFNYMLQIPAIFLGISVLNDILLAGLQVVLGFPICRSCLFLIMVPGLPIAPICLIPGYTSIVALQASSGTLSTPVSIENAIFLIVLIHGLRHIPTIMSDLMNRVSGFYGGLSLSGAAAMAGSSMMGMFSQATGMSAAGFRSGTFSALRTAQLKKLAIDTKLNEDAYKAKTKSIHDETKIISKKTEVVKQAIMKNAAYKNTVADLMRMQQQIAREGGIVSLSLAKKLADLSAGGQMTDDQRKTAFAKLYDIAKKDIQVLEAKARTASDDEKIRINAQILEIKKKIGADKASSAMGRVRSDQPLFDKAKDVEARLAAARAAANAQEITTLENELSALKDDMLKRTALSSSARRANADVLAMRNASIIALKERKAAIDAAIERARAEDLDLSNEVPPFDRQLVEMVAKYRRLRAKRRKLKKNPISNMRELHNLEEKLDNIKFPGALKSLKDYEDKADQLMSLAPKSKTELDDALNISKGMADDSASLKSYLRSTTPPTEDYIRRTSSSLDTIGVPTTCDDLLSSNLNSHKQLRRASIECRDKISQLDKLEVADSTIDSMNVLGSKERQIADILADGNTDDLAKSVMEKMLGESWSQYNFQGASELRKAQDDLLIDMLTGSPRDKTRTPLDADKLHELLRTGHTDGAPSLADAVRMYGPDSIGLEQHLDLAALDREVRYEAKVSAYGDNYKAKMEERYKDPYKFDRAEQRKKSDRYEQIKRLDEEIQKNVASSLKKLDKYSTLKEGEASKLMVDINEVVNRAVDFDLIDSERAQFLIANNHYQQVLDEIKTSSTKLENYCYDQLHKNTLMGNIAALGGEGAPNDILRGRILGRDLGRPDGPPPTIDDVYMPLSMYTLAELGAKKHIYEQRLAASKAARTAAEAALKAAAVDNNAAGVRGGNP